MDKYLHTPTNLKPTVANAIQILESGGVVGIPTETVYGLAACIDQPAGIDQVFALKNRPKDHPLIVHIGDPNALKKYTQEIPHYVEILIQKFWPGPLTLILKKTEAVSDVITAGQDSVAIRMPNHPIALELLKKLKAPVVAPSANKFMQVSPTSRAHVLEGLGEDLLVLEGGECEVGIESTIVDARNPTEAVIVRPGMIGLEDLVAVLKDSRVPVRYFSEAQENQDHQDYTKDVHSGDLQASEKSNALKAPGLCKKHYSPVKKLYLLKSKKLLAELLIQLAKEHGPDVGMYFLSFGFSEELFELYQAMDNYFVTHDMPTMPAQYAQELYGALHEADESHATVIIVECPPKTKEWVAVLDRLVKAAG